MPFGAQADDDQIPQYSLGQLVAGAQQGQLVPSAAPIAAPQSTQQPQQAPQQAPQQVPYYIAAPTAPAAQPAQPAAPQGGSSVALPSVPSAPQFDAAQYQKYENAVQQYKPGTVSRNDPSLKPSVGRRALGALAGALMTYGHVQGAQEMGDAVVHKKYNDAEADRTAKEAGAQQDLSNFEHQYDLSRKGYEDQVRQFGDQMQVANANRTQLNEDRTAAGAAEGRRQAQANSDREFNRQVGNDTFTHNRETGEDKEKGREFNATNAREGARDAETARHNKATEAIDKEKADTDSGKNGGKVYTQKEYQDLITQRDKEYADAQKQMDEELNHAGDEKEAAAIHGRWQSWAAGKQQEWNNRLSTADPDGTLARGGVARSGNGAPAGTPAPQARPATQRPQQSAPAQQQTQRPQPTQQQQQQAPRQAVGRQAKPTKLTDKAVVAQYLAKAGGDPAKARQLATQDNYTF